jgi:OPT oligopeptide transporter protein
MLTLPAHRRSLALACFGVFAAVPLRTQVIEREELRFPSGTATAEVIRTLHAAGPPLESSDMARGAHLGNSTALWRRTGATPPGKRRGGDRGGTLRREVELSASLSRTIDEHAGEDDLESRPAVRSRRGKACHLALQTAACSITDCRDCALRRRVRSVQNVPLAHAKFEFRASVSRGWTALCDLKGSMLVCRKMAAWTKQWRAPLSQPRQSTRR